MHKQLSMVEIQCNVIVISHLLSAAYKLTSGPLHVSLGITAQNSLTRNAVSLHVHVHV